MRNITLETKRKLESVGFSFSDYERFLNLGMVYSYQEDEYVVGGFCNTEFSQTDEEVVQNGEWLPDSDQLFQWLQQCDFDVSVRWGAEDGRFYISATHPEHGEFQTQGVDLANGLASVIYKICKATQGQCVPESLMRAKILTEEKE